MSKRKHCSAPKTPKESKDNAQRPKRRLVKKAFSSFWIAYGALAAFATIWIAVTPRVYVYTSVALDPANPMFTMFVVRNEGYLAIRDVEFKCSIDSLTRPDGTQVKAEVPYDNSFSDPQQVAPVIAPGEEASELLPLSGMKHNQFGKADIAVRILFRPYKLWPFYVREELHRFETRQGKDGQWHWFPQPINK